MPTAHAALHVSDKPTSSKCWWLHQKSKTPTQAGSPIICCIVMRCHHELSFDVAETSACTILAELRSPRSDRRRRSGQDCSGSADIHPADHAGWQIDSDQMTTSSLSRGGAPVGFISELDSIEAASVIYLRLWCDGPNARAQVWNDFASGLGPDQGRKALKSFEELCSLCTRHCRRPLMRHSVHCKCLGADESCFANFIATAATGKREEAMLIATLLVRPDVAPLIASLAADVGLALLRMRLSAPRDIATTNHHTPRTLH